MNPTQPATTDHICHECGTAYPDDPAYAEMCCTFATSDEEIDEPYQTNLARLANLEAAVIHHTERGHTYTAWTLRKQADHLRREMRDTMMAAGEPPSPTKPCPICGFTGGRGVRCVWCQGEGA